MGPHFEGGLEWRYNGLISKDFELGAHARDHGINFENSVCSLLGETCPQLGFSRREAGCYPQGAELSTWRFETHPSGPYEP